MIPSEITDWPEFLKEHGIDDSIDYDEWIMFLCPFHDQTDTSRPSFGIHKETGIGNCFGCGRHEWEEICDYFGISPFDFIDGTRESVWNLFKRKVLKIKKKETYKRYKLPESLVNPYSFDKSRKYFTDRNIHKDILELLHIRFCINEESKYYNYIIFPIYDERDVLFFDARYVGLRAYKSRWLRPKDAAVDRTYFNWTNVVHNEYLCLVEGATDVLKMVQFGLMNTIAAKYFSPMQLEMILRHHFKYIFLAYDNDEAGRYKFNSKGWNISFNAKAKFMLGNAGMSIHEIKFPNGVKDPADIKYMNDLLNLNPILNEFV